MGRVKLPISKILNNTNRQVTYSKRRNGILKKAYEIAVLCDIDVALIMISPSGRITFFSGTRRIEDVLLQYFNLSDDEIELDEDSDGLVNDREGVINSLMKLKTEAAAHQSPKNLSTHAEEVFSLQQQLEMAKEQLRSFEPAPQKFTSLHELESCEEQLLKTLRFIEQRKKDLLRNHSSSYNEQVEQIHPMAQYMMNAQDENTPHTLLNPNFSSWHEHLKKQDMNGFKYMHMGSETSPIFQESQSSTTGIGVLSEPTLHNDKLSAEGCSKIRSLSEECIQQWRNSSQLYPVLLPQEMSHSPNEIHVPDAASIIISPLQYNQPN